MRVRMLGLLAAAALLTGGLIAAPATIAPAPTASAAADAGYTAGAPQYSNVIDCASIIFGTGGGASRGIMTWVGAYVDAQGQHPRAGETFYVQMTVGGIGNPCPGTYVRPGFTLPAGLTLDTAGTVECYFNGQFQSPGSTYCPQSGAITGSTSTFSYLSNDTANARLFGVPQGSTWVFRFPVKASGAVANGTIRGTLQIADGNDNPTLQPTGPYTVFSGTATGSPGSANYRFFADTPSTKADPSTPTGVMSRATVYTNNVAGTIYLAKTTGTTADPNTWTDRVTVSAVGPDAGWNVWTDWDNAGSPYWPGKQYRWAVGFKGNTDSRITWSPIESFISLDQLTCNGQQITIGIGLGQLPTAGNDVILGTQKSEVIAAGDGNDAVCALGGDDVIAAGAGNDFVDAGAGNDRVSLGGPSGSGNAADGGPGTDMLDFSDATASVNVDLRTSEDQASPGTGWIAVTGFENVAGGSGADTLTGNDGPNLLIGGAGSDTLTGGGGNDVLKPGAGDDTMDGGTGTDRVSYADATGAIKLWLGTTSPQTTGGSGLDRLTGVESISGSRYGDKLTGNGSANTIQGGAGNDTIAGGGGDDGLYGDAGADVIRGDQGNDRVFGADGNDQLYGGVGNDRIAGEAGNDRLLGEAGNDTITGGSGNDALSGGSGTDTGDGGSGRDTASSIERRSNIP